MMGTGIKLQELLKSKDMTVAELSRKSGISAQTIYSIIRRDNVNIKFDVAIKIAKALDIDFLELMDEQDSFKRRREQSDVKQYGEIRKRNFIESIESIEEEETYLKNAISSMFFSFSSAAQWEQKIEELYQLLNKEGQKKADEQLEHTIEQIELLTKIPEYQQDPNMNKLSKILQDNQIKNGNKDEE